MSSSERCSYVTAATAARNVARAACARNLTPNQWRAFVAVVSLTAMYSKLEDRVYLGQVASFMFGVERAERWHKTTAGEALRALSEMGFIEREAPGVGRPWAGSGPQYLVAIPARYAPGPGSIDQGMHPASAPNAPGRRVWNAPESGDPPEEIDRVDQAEEEHLAELPAVGHAPDATGADTLRARAVALLQENSRQTRTEAADELESVLATLSGKHGDGAVGDALDALAAGGTRYRWPSGIRDALRANLDRSAQEREGQSVRKRRLAAAHEHGRTLGLALIPHEERLAVIEHRYADGDEANAAMAGLREVVGDGRSNADGGASRGGGHYPPQMGIGTPTESDKSHGDKGVGATP